MRIVFICSCLYPGQDGVGDYTRRLAGELIRQGQEVRMLALNDKSSYLHARDSQLLKFLEFQSSEGTAVLCLRLPGSLSWPERVALARQWVEDFNPDWVSLQFVPFGFHPKGLCFGLEKHLAAIIGNRSLHWMFHELWVLWIFPLSLRKRLLGQVQKIWLRSALKKLKPQVVTTQLRLYQAELKRLGIPAQVLPLHGNIPVVASSTGAKSWLEARCSLPESCEVTAVGFFGAILSTSDRSLFATQLAGRKVSGKELLVLSAGKLGSDGEQLWNSLAQEFKASATFFKLGALEEREASLYFAALDYGLTAYPPALMGKSGSVAAMREHGLTVLACGSMGKTSGRNGLPDELNQSWTVSQSARSLLQQLQARHS